MPFGLPEVSSLLEDLYLPSPGADFWQRFLRRLQQVSGASKVYLVLVGPDARANIPVHLGCVGDFVSCYGSDWAHRDVVLAAYLDAQERSGRDYIGHRHSVIGDRAFHRSEIYRSLFRLEGDSELCFATLSQLPGGLIGGLCLRRSDSKGPFDDDVISLLTILAPHMRRSLQLRYSSRSSQSMAHLGATILSAFDISAILTDDRGDVLYTSPAAKRILDSGEGLRLSEGRLNARSPEDDSELQALLGSVLTKGSDGPRSRALNPSTPGKGMRAKTRKNVPIGYDGAMLVGKGEGFAPLHLSCTAFGTEQALEGQPAKLIFLADMDAKTSPRSPLLRALYRLTPTESNLVDLLISGSDVKQAAISLNLKETTARFHLKEIFRKTGVRSQPALLRLALNLPSTPSSSNRQSSHLGDGVAVDRALPLSH